MPVTLIDRLPLPNLKVYSAGSVLVVSAAVYYATLVTSDPAWRANMTDSPPGEKGGGAGLGDQLPPPGLVAHQVSRNLTEQLTEVMTYMMHEPLCMWTLINLAYCSLAVFGLVVQRAVFGQLRVAEAQRVKDKFWNFVFYKFIFVFGVINVQYMDEVLLWCSWFTLLGFLHIMGQLCKDRFEYLSSVSTTTATWAHARLGALVGGVALGAGGLLVAAATLAPALSRDTLAFMAAECVLVAMAAAQVAARYLVAALGADAGSPPAHHAQLALETAAIAVELAHVVHMVVYSNMLVSMASLVLLMQLRHLVHELQARVARHRRFAVRSGRVAAACPPASAEEVRRHADKCAICWEPMSEARRLPCRHLFHSACLCRWVQHDASCPTCRRALPAVAAPPDATPPRAAPPAPDAVARRTDHLFHFDGSRYVSWLPSFSVEVTRVRPRRDVTLADAHTDPPAAPAAPTRAHTHTHTSPPPTPAPLPPSPVVPTEPYGMVEEIASRVDTAHSATPTAALAGPTGPSATAEPAGRSAAGCSARFSVATETYPSLYDERTWQFGVMAAEREARLALRKARLVAAARARYLAARAAPPAPPAPPAD